MQDDTVKVSRKQLLAACGLMRGKLPAGRYSFPKRDTPLLRVKPYQSPNSEVCYETEAILIFRYRHLCKQLLKWYLWNDSGAYMCTGTQQKPRNGVCHWVPCHCTIKGLTQWILPFGGSASFSQFYELPKAGWGFLVWLTTSTSVSELRLPGIKSSLSSRPIPWQVG